MNHQGLATESRSSLCCSRKSDLLLVRHPDVDAAFRGICYGQSDVALSRAGRRSCHPIAETVAGWDVAHVFHSGLQRTRLLAEFVGHCTGVTPICDTALRERDFGAWEMQSWDEIYQREGDDMMRMVSEPADFRPGGGETTREFADRVWRWYQRMPRGGICVAVCHGGTIASLLGRYRSLPISHWPRLTPACGEMVWHESDDPRAGLSTEREEL